jgi:catechol 2,3-dioxygenase-like lactoylglutathione lyase family enzyme
MIGYVTIGTNDFEKSRPYYDALLAEFGGKRAWDNERVQGYAAPTGMVALCKPFNGERMTVGNGAMFAFSAKTREQVDQVYAKAMALGSTDEGAPGERSPTFYGAYFRDLEGNKLCVFKVG